MNNEVYSCNVSVLLKTKTLLSNCQNVMFSAVVVVVVVAVAVKLSLLLCQPVLTPCFLVFCQVSYSKERKISCDLL